MMRPYASNVEQSCLGKSLAICMTRGPLGLHEIMNSATSLFRGLVLIWCVCVRVYVCVTVCVIQKFSE